VRVISHRLVALNGINKSAASLVFDYYHKPNVVVYCDYDTDDEEAVAQVDIFFQANIPQHKEA